MVSRRRGSLGGEYEYTLRKPQAIDGLAKAVVNTSMIPKIAFHLANMFESSLQRAQYPSRLLHHQPTNCAERYGNLCLWSGRATRDVACKLRDDVVQHSHA